MQCSWKVQTLHHFNVPAMRGCGLKSKEAWPEIVSKEPWPARTSIFFFFMTAQDIKNILLAFWVLPRGCKSLQTTKPFFPVRTVNEPCFFVASSLTNVHMGNSAPKPAAGVMTSCFTWRLMWFLNRSPQLQQLQRLYLQVGRLFLILLSTLSLFFFFLTSVYISQFSALLHQMQHCFSLVPLLFSKALLSRPSCQVIVKRTEFAQSKVALAQLAYCHISYLWHVSKGAPTSMLLLNMV